MGEALPSARRRPDRPNSFTTRNSQPKNIEAFALFLGLKNPWLGKTVYDSSQASLWSRTLVVNAGKKVPVESAQTQKFYQADKRVGRREEPVKTSAYLGRGSVQGSLNQISDKIDKNMTIEQVRELLNKDR